MVVPGLARGAIRDTRTVGAEHSIHLSKINTFWTQAANCKWNKQRENGVVKGVVGGWDAQLTYGLIIKVPFAR